MPDKTGRETDGGTPSITVTENGPYQVEGSIPLAKQTIVADEEGGSRDWLEWFAPSWEESLGRLKRRVKEGDS